MYAAIYDKVLARAGTAPHLARPVGASAAVTQQSCDPLPAGLVRTCEGGAAQQKCAPGHVTRGSQRPSGRQDREEGRQAAHAARAAKDVGLFFKIRRTPLLRWIAAALPSRPSARQLRTLRNKRSQVRMLAPPAWGARWPPARRPTLKVTFKWVAHKGRGTGSERAAATP